MKLHSRSLPLPLLILLALVLAVSTAFHAEKEEVDEIQWLTLEEAFVRNQKEPRRIFVDVYTDWCGWCKRMDKDTFGNKQVAQYVNEKYYAVKLNAESDRRFSLGQAEMTERQVARQFGVSGYPTVVFIYEDFRTIEAVPGYHKPDKFIEILKAFAGKSLKN
jgi:thioredoxin-related protein